MKALITGGAGFIGCHLASRLLAAGHEVTVADNLHPQVHTEPGLPRALPRDVRFVPLDVTLGENFTTLFRYFKPDVVVHLAAETGTGQSLTQSRRHTNVNVNGTACLLDALHAAGHVPEQFLLSSSRAVYGEGAWKTAEGAQFYPGCRSRVQLEKKQWAHRGPRGESAEPVANRADQVFPQPVSVYGATKLAQEHVLSAWCSAFGSALTVFRCQNVYGPGQSPGNPYTGVLTFFATQAARKQRLDVYEDGEIYRDFVHVEDVVSAMAAALAQPAPGVRTLDLGAGVRSTILEVARSVSKLYGIDAPAVSGRYRDGDVRSAWADISLTRAAIGYTPKWKIDDGLASLKAWLESR